MLTLRAGYGKKLYPDSFVADIVRRMHEDHTLTSASLYRQLVEQEIISPLFKEWQIESFVNGNPRFRNVFVQKYGADAYKAWKDRLKTASLHANGAPKPPMDFRALGVSRFAEALAIHTRKKQTPAFDTDTDEEDED